MAVAGMAKSIIPQANKMYHRPVKIVHHRCGYSLFTKVLACWGPVVDHRDYVPVITCVHVGYWDESRRQVFACPGCGQELQVWWPFYGSSGKP